jgi:hypothetical protein
MALINVPLASQSLGQTNASIRGNFAVIDAAFQVDHVDYNTTGQGKHNQVTFPVQAAQPTFLSGEEALYNFLNPTTTKNELYIHKQTSISTSDIPFTASILSQTTPPNDSQGWTLLPSGILLRWVSISGNGKSQVTLLSGPIPFISIYSIQLTVVDPSNGDVNTAVRLVSIDSNTQFTVYFSSRTSSGAAAGSAKVLIIGR